MADIEKVIKGLECCLRESEHIDDNPCADCPYFDVDSGIGGKCIDDKDKDALELLKEQEAMLVEYSEFGGMKYGGCPRCSARIENLVNPKACGFCGQAVKWE